jgi:fimbrial chaperone protein
VRAACFAALALAGAPLVAVAPAWADGLEVVPVQVNLTRGTPNALVSLKNDGAQETRYQIELFAWAQSREGALELSPSKDLVFFPALFALKPGEQRNLRIGSDPALFGPLEKTYRVFIQELPPAQREQASNGIRVLTRVGIPVFLNPIGAAAAKPELHSLSAALGKISFSLRNTGTAHLRPSAVRAVARSASGDLVKDHLWDAWYLLAGGERVYAWAFPAAECSSVRVVEAEVALESGVMRASVKTPRGVCGP